MINVIIRFWYASEESSATFMNWIVQVAEYSDPPKVFSISYGIPEHYLTFYEIFVFDNEIKKLGLQGVTVLAASGTFSFLFSLLTSFFLLLVFTI